MSVKIQEPGVAQRLVEFFRLKGRFRPMLEEYIQPVIQVGDLSVGGVPAISRHATCWFNVAAVAGQQWAFHMEVPPGLLCHITSFNLNPSASVSLYAGFSGGAPMSPITNKYFTDGRITGDISFPTNVPGAIVGSNAQVGAINPIGYRSYVLVGQPNHFKPKGWIVGTGKPAGIGRFQLGAATVNITISGSVEWDEYQVA